MTAFDNRPLSHGMLLGGVAPLSSFALAVFLPLLGRLVLPDSEFAIWALLSTVAAIALMLDFGGPVFVAALVPRRSSQAWPIIKRGIIFSAGGSLGVGAIACVAWAVLARVQPIAGWGLISGSAAFLLTALGAMLRSVAVIVASFALLRGDMRLRNRVIIGQAVAQLVFTAVLALIWRSAWLFPVGLVGSSFLIAVPAILMVRSRLHKEVANLQVEGVASPEYGSAEVPLFSIVRQFAVARTGATVLSMVLTQGDRWVIGALGGAGALASYELAWRLAVIPKLVALAITQSLVPRAALLEDPSVSNIDSLVRKSSGVTLAVIAPVAAGIMALTFLVLPHIAQGKLEPMLPVFSLLLLGHSMHALTAPATSTLIGLGRPAAELRYLIVAVLVTTAGWTIAWASRNTVAVAAAVAAGLIAGCMFLAQTHPWSEEDYLRPPVSP